MYSIKELISAAQKQFGLNPALVEAALKETGKTQFTFDEARAIVNEFSKREVKTNG